MITEALWVFASSRLPRSAFQTGGVNPFSFSSATHFSARRICSFFDNGDMTMKRIHCAIASMHCFEPPPLSGRWVSCKLVSASIESISEWCCELDNKLMMVSSPNLVKPAYPALM